MPNPRDCLGCAYCDVFAESRIRTMIIHTVQSTAGSPCLSTNCDCLSLGRTARTTLGLCIIAKSLIEPNRSDCTVGYPRATSCSARADLHVHAVFRAEGEDGLRLDAAVGRDAGAEALWSILLSVTIARRV